MSGKFETFIAEMTTLLDPKPSEADLLPVCGQRLATLVATDDWLPDVYAVSNPEIYCQYLLYRDPHARFSVVSFVWGPGQETPIHDHRVWGAIGMLRGAETGTLFSREDETGKLSEGSSVTLQPGMVDFVSPRLGDIHRVRNALADQASISIHVYGADIGAVERRVYDPDSGEPKPFITGYTPLPKNS
jgi:3-mercaptopropionate dioxygenase